MPRLIDPVSRGDAIINGAARVIVDRGLSGLTLRAIAAEAGVGASSLVHQFGNRDRLLRVMVMRLGRRRVEVIDRRSHRDGGLAYLPTDEDELADARIWLACCELGREMPDVGAAVADVREEERLLMDVLTERQLDEPGLDVVMAVVDGLTAALCAPLEPLPVVRARAALARVLPPCGQPGSVGQARERAEPASAELRSSA